MKTCPDHAALGRIGAHDADPELVEHLKTCPSCWLDWQIQHGLRHVLDPQIPVRADLNERVIARMALRAAQLEKTLRWQDLAVSAVLVLVATGVFFLATGTAGSVVSVTTALYAIAGGIAAALYVKREDRSERAAALAAAGVLIPDVAAPLARGQRDGVQ
ncbi:MAG: DUF3379 domain-containing protein [Gemmatimonadetes bacterium]|nr:DUF3379 domain-containing protein [Gemmatimonadota bacterium]MXX72085.1 DUF3379 domain-containing protein [Gemmatimonadota bacterium]MYC91053.1 DUF3379 domain-containing protein [Gemmatimonadota bacterium]MYG36617.1 DUF3379 domain-containing protein [Gemmatimonadota bacterium]MYJ18733.1 DUF3379 domain-containing protein [Gemmatimonadota bacterium]